MYNDAPAPEAKALAAAEEPLEAMMRRIISEFKSKPTETKKPYSQSEREAYRKGRHDAQGDRSQYQGGRQEARPDHYPQQARPAPHPSMQTRDNIRPPQRPPASASLPQLNQGPYQGRGYGRQQPGNLKKYGNPAGPRQRFQDRKVYGAAEEDYDDGDNTDLGNQRTFSVSAQPEDEDWNDGDGEDRYAMMGRRDYSFNDFEGDDEGQA
jgi:hypothetical protein